MAKTENKPVLYITTFTFEKPFISPECERSKPSHPTEKYVPDFNLKELRAFRVRLSRDFSNGPQHGFKSLMNTYIACSMLKCAFSILQHTSMLASHSIIAQVIWRKLFLLSKNRGYILFQFIVSSIFLAWNHHFTFLYVHLMIWLFALNLSL